MRQSFSRFVCCIVIRGVHECQSTWISEQVCKVIWVIANHHFTKKNTNEERRKKKRKNCFPHTATWSAYTPFFLSSPYPFGSFVSTPPLFCALPCFCTLAWKLEGNLEGKRGVSPRVSPVELESVFSLQERKSANWPHNCNFGYLPRGQQAHVTSDSASAVAEVRPG